MEVKWLQDFLALAETSNFTRAAEKRHVSQAAFSRRIQQLEQWLGKPLIDRSLFPMRLTEAGEHFLPVAADLLRQALDIRQELGGRSGKDAQTIRIALPFALATSKLPLWWKHWTDRVGLTAEIISANVHDLGESLISGHVDLMICFHSAQQPIELPSSDIAQLSISRERLLPYGERSLVEAGRFAFPGTPEKPVPLLTYSKGVYFARLVDLIIENAPEPLHATTVIESDMSDVLRDMAAHGHGVAWLPESTVAVGGGAALAPLPASPWELDLSIEAFRHRANRSRPLSRLWTLLQAEADANFRTRQASAGGRPPRASSSRKAGQSRISSTLRTARIDQCD